MRSFFRIRRFVVYRRGSAGFFQEEEEQVQDVPAEEDATQVQDVFEDESEETDDEAGVFQSVNEQSEDPFPPWGSDRRGQPGSYRRRDRSPEGTNGGAFSYSGKGGSGFYIVRDFG